MKLHVRLLIAAVAALISVPAARAEIKLPQAIRRPHGPATKDRSRRLGLGRSRMKKSPSPSVDSTKATAKTGCRQWQVEGQAHRSGAAGDKPLTLSVKGKNEIVLKDVLAGEVWVASGQSNMEWSVAASLNPAEEAKNATHPLIRMIKVKKTVAESPQEDIIVDPGTKKTTPTSGWAVSAPDTAPSFSAVGYYFARSLQQD
jgi:sialate O-acetylesterase